MKYVKVPTKAYIEFLALFDRSQIAAPVTEIVRVRNAFTNCEQIEEEDPGPPPE